MDDVLDIITEAQEVKGASTMLRQRIVRGDELLVEADVRVAFVSGGRARPIPKPLRIAMKGDLEAGAGNAGEQRLRSKTSGHFR
jgi:acyl-CoA thioester hydrolase